MARTKSEAGKKAGGKATRKAPTLRTTPAVKSGSVSKGTKRKGSAGARNSACKRPVPKWQMPIGKFLSKDGSSKEAAAGAPPKEGEVDMEVVEVDAPTTAAATGNADRTVKEAADSSTVEEEDADTSTVEEKDADTSTVEEKDAYASGTKDKAADTSTMEDCGNTSTIEDDGNTSTVEDDGNTSTVEDEADDTSVVEGEADSSMVADATVEKSMNGDKASGDDAKNEGSSENGNMKKNVQENGGKPGKEEGEVSNMDGSSSDIKVAFEIHPKKEVPKISHDEVKEDKV